jgi:hypothetical protein
MSQLAFVFSTATEPQQPSTRDHVPQRGLLIRDPYLSDILQGEKRWELRSFATRIRGPVGLIKSTTGRVFGEGVLRECIGPLDLEVLLNSSEIGPHDSREIKASGQLPYKNEAGESSTYAWVFEDVHVYPEPIPYRHPSGAVTFVDLTRAIGC